jgi:hypothetical protein
MANLAALMVVHEFQVLVVLAVDEPVDMSPRAIGLDP